MATTILPDYTQSGRYTGEYPALRWLARLDYDFRKSGMANASASQFFEAIEILFDGPAASWLDSLPRFRQIIDNREQATQLNVIDFMEALKAEFANQAMDLSEVSVQDDIRTFAQATSESLTSYYQRATHLLRRAHGRDKPRDPTSPNQLSPIEETVLHIIILAFIEGLSDDKLRSTVLSRFVLSCGSLRTSMEILQETQRNIIITKEIEERLSEKREFQQLRQLFPD